jgi:hypothetical protein
VLGTASFLTSREPQSVVALPLPIVQQTLEAVASTAMPTMPTMPGSVHAAAAEASSPASSPSAPGTPDVHVGPLIDPFLYREDRYLPRPGPEAGGELEFVTPRGGGVLAMPVRGRKTSRFGMRLHPTLHYYKLHTGLDFAAPCGTPIGASAAGRVTFVGWAGGNGNMISIDHGRVNGYRVTTNYGHLSSASVTVGQQVAQHQAIGRVGTTGNSTGCHLHLEVRADGQFTDPEDWLSGSGRVVTQGMTEFAFDASASASPSPSPSPSPSASPSPSPSPSLSPSPSPSPSPIPSPSPDASPSPSPSPGQGAESGPNPSPSAEVSPSPEPTTEEPSAPAEPSPSEPSPSPSEPSPSPSTTEPGGGESPEPSEAVSRSESPSPSPPPEPTEPESTESVTPGPTG